MDPRVKPEDDEPFKKGAYLHLTDSFELYTALKRLNLLENSQPLWWPEHGTFEVVIGAILTQNTQWASTCSGW